MTHIELRDLLVDRIGFLQDVGFDDFTVDADNLKSDSGRKFQDGHPTVTLENILWSMPKAPVDAAAFNAHLKVLIERAIILVISDVFEVNDIQETLLDSDGTILDEAISQRMVILVGEGILSSTRSSRLDAVNKSVLALQIEGREGKFIGIKGRYEKEMRRVKDSLGQERMLDVSTLGTLNYNSDI